MFHICGSTATDKICSPTWLLIKTTEEVQLVVSLCWDVHRCQMFCCTLEGAGMQPCQVLDDHLLIGFSDWQGSVLFPVPEPNFGMFKREKKGFGT